MTSKKNDRRKESAQTPIAVIGLAGILPDAKDVTGYWENILNEVDTIKDVPPSRWRIEDYYDPDPKSPDKSYSKRGGFLPDIDFNPMDFGLPPNILEITDVSQLLSLVVARDALKDAGYGDENVYSREKTGIILGVGGGQKLVTPLIARLQYPVWRKVLVNSGMGEDDADIIIEKIKKSYVGWEENSFPGLLGNVIAGRVANRLNLGGTNCVIDAACASSLAAMKMAVSDLVEHRSDMMITGGVDTDNSPFMYMCFSKTPAFTKEDNVCPFDENSKGMLVGEGVGMVVLKRMEDAVRDRDRIYAVIKGVGSSSDGKFKSIYAPRAEGQAKALRQAYDIAGYLPETVGLIEAHGTGTSVGDNVEFSAIKDVFGENGSEKQHIALGSIKSQIGHAKSAAGAAGFIKAALALHHKVLPCTINVKKPHPNMDIENSPCYINSKNRPWFPSEKGYPRRASVSAFGFGGTNFHFALEEYSKEQGAFSRIHSTPHSIVVSDTSPEKLIAKLNQLKKDLSVENTESAFYHLVTGYKPSPVKNEDARLGFIAASPVEAVEQIELALKRLESKKDIPFEIPKGVYYRPKGIGADAKVVALFPGQGSQYLEMGKDVAINFPEVMDSFSQMDDIFTKEGNPPLTKTIFPIPKFNKEEEKEDEIKLQDTSNAQPSIGAFSAGLYEILLNAGFKADFFAGHSFGELTALWAAGVLSKEDFYFLAHKRGEAMKAPEDKSFDAGTMAAVMGDLKNLEENIKGYPDVKIANYNSDSQMVIAGPKKDMELLQKELKEKKYKVIPLPVSAAFHTPLVGHAGKPFAKAIDSVKFNAPTSPVYSNTTGEKYTEKPARIKQILKDHVLNAVLFKKEIESLYNDGGRIFVEIGPKDVLSKLTGSILKDKPHISVSVNSVPKNSSDHEFRKAAVKLCVAGLSLSNIDPYMREIKAPEEPKGHVLNVKLNGSNYMSDKTKTAYQDALNDGFKIRQAKVVKEIVEVTKEVNPQLERVPMKSEDKKEKKDAGPDVPSTQNRSEKGKKGSVSRRSTPPGYSRTNGGLENVVTGFLKHQDEMLKVHSGYLENAREYSKTFHHLMDQQLDIVKSHPGMNFPETITRSMDMFHQHQGDTLKAHTSYLDTQSDTSREALDLIKGKGAKLYSASTAVYDVPGEKEESNRSGFHRNEERPEIVSLPRVIEDIPPVEMGGQELPEEEMIKSENENIVSAVDSKPLSDSPIADLNAEMLEIVAEKTGYPVEMLELDMDMEADLGIDSIKRVEILAKITDKHPEFSAIDTDELASLKTLGEIVNTFESFLGTSGSVSETVEKTAGGKYDEGKLKDSLMEIVSEKTGYPVEMLEFDMDMEADLGIDSIKRVEILSRFTEENPGLPEVDTDRLAELKTLGEISEAFGEMFSKNVPPSSPVGIAQKGQGTAPDFDKLNDSLMGIVSDKTGYPVEMLELDMDMEADLGIDSIKRVEILSGFTEKNPGLPEMDTEELAQCKTLGEIVNICKKVVESPSIGSEEQTPKESGKGGPDLDVLNKTMLEVVSEKTGYPVEMLESDMDMEAELGIDSIKRVEILSKVTELHPEVSDINPDSLAELKTLGAIVEKMSEALSGDTELPGKHEKEDVNNVPGACVDRSIPVLKKIGVPDHLDFKFKEGDVCVLTGDGTKLTGLLSGQLKKSGLNPVVLSLPKIPSGEKLKLSGEIPEMKLSDFKEETLVDMIAEIEKKYGHIAGYIHLNPKPSSSSKNPICFPKNEKDVLLNVFLTAKHLKKSLSKIQNQRQFFMTVSRMDGKLGITGKIENPVAGGFFGLTKTLGLEWKDIYCRAIDISCEYSDKDASQAILGELFDPDRRVTEVGIGPLGRFTLDRRLSPQPDTAEMEGITSSSVFLVSGGAKGVTAKCIIQLAKDAKCHFILLGRSAYSGKSEPDWAKGVTDEATLKKNVMLAIKEKGEKPTPKRINELIKPVLSEREIGETLECIRENGASAEYISSDVTNTKEIEKSLEPVIEKYGDISGIIHGAGVLADKFIEDKTPKDFNAVYSTKINGLDALLSCVKPEKLTHVALFSSAAGFFGNEGQSDYAIANEILNKTAYKLKALFPECHVNAFGWGPWDGGMVTPELKRMFEKRGVNVIPVPEGTQLFSREMRMKECFPQIIVGSSMKQKAELSEDYSLKNYRIRSAVKLENNHFLKDHAIGGNPVLPTVCATFWMADACEKLYPGFKFFRCMDYKLFKGIVFNGSEPDMYHIDIEEVKKISSGEIIFDVKISSEGKKGNRINHYASKIALTNQVPEADVMSAFNLSETELSNGSDYYKDGTLFHGPNFQAIERIINMNENGLTMECRTPDISEEAQGDFQIGTFNPYAADVQFQSMLIWVRKYMNSGSLPSKAVDGFHFRNVPRDETFYVTLDVKKKTKSTVTADIYTHDDKGKMFTSVNDAEVTVSASLNKLFAKAV